MLLYVYTYTYIIQLMSSLILVVIHVPFTVHVSEEFRPWVRSQELSSSAYPASAIGAT